MIQPVTETMMMMTTTTMDNVSSTIPIQQEQQQQYHNVFATHMYAGMFYISPERQMKNHFTMPFSPPDIGTQVMFGTATRLQSIPDLIVAQQKQEQQMGSTKTTTTTTTTNNNIKPACVFGSTASSQFLQQVYRQLQVYEFFGTEDDVVTAIYDGTCPIFIFDYPIATQFILRRSLPRNNNNHKNKNKKNDIKKDLIDNNNNNDDKNNKNECFNAQNEPIGIIGEPMTFGLTHYALGIRQDIPIHVVDTLSYWMNYLMNCNPLNHDNDNDKDNVHHNNNNNGGMSCPDGNLATFYQNQGGTGKECGYNPYPPLNNNNKKANVPLITGVVIGSVLTILILILVLFHMIRLKQQEQRYKYRFVEQIARNIEIGPSPGLIPPEKLAQEIQYISDGKGWIQKNDLLNWIMNDIKLTFLSENDFNALWDAMDVHKTNKVDPIEFFCFLSACGSQFHQVYTQHSKLPKTERLKLAARRLTNLQELGEDGVRKIEHKLDRGSKEMIQQQQQQPKQQSKQQQHTQQQQNPNESTSSYSFQDRGIRASLGHGRVGRRRPNNNNNNNTKGRFNPKSPVFYMRRNQRRATQTQQYPSSSVDMTWTERSSGTFHHHHVNNKNHNKSGKNNKNNNNHQVSARRRGRRRRQCHTEVVVSPPPQEQEQQQHKELESQEEQEESLSVIEKVVPTTNEDWNNNKNNNTSYLEFSEEEDDDDGEEEEKQEEEKQEEETKDYNTGYSYHTTTMDEEEGGGGEKTRTTMMTLFMMMLLWRNTMPRTIDMTWKIFS